MHGLRWIVILGMIGGWFAIPATTQETDDALVFEGTEITMALQMEQTRTTSDPLAPPESTVSEDTLAFFADQIFVGSVWTLAADGVATFEFGRDYDLDDFGISEEYGVITGTWIEKRNGELSVEINVDFSSPDFSETVLLGLSADITVGEGRTIATTNYFQLVMFSNVTSAVSDMYSYIVQVALEEIDDGGDLDRDEEPRQDDAGEDREEGAEPPDETPELVSVDDADNAEELADEVISWIEDGVADGEFDEVGSELYDLATDESLDNVELFVVTLEWYSRLFPDASLVCEPAVVGSHGGVVSGCEFKGVADDDAVEDLLDMTRRRDSDDDAEVEFDVTIFMLIEDGSIAQAQFVPDYLEMLDQLDEFYESA